MSIKELIKTLETVAPPAYQESYDNAGLITGSPNWDCTGVLCSLDCVEQTVAEAAEKGCNLIVAHHPIVFKGIKKLTGADYVQRTIILAIKYDIAIYAIHTNLDSVATGVNKKIADLLGLQNTRILAPKENLLSSLITFAPKKDAERIRQSLYTAGAGQIGNYADCSFSVTGNGTFTPNTGAAPTTGRIGKAETVEEERIELIFPRFLQQQIVTALKEAHSYEEVAYYISPLSNVYQNIGSGMIGELPAAVSPTALFDKIKTIFNVKCIKHTRILKENIMKIAICGGSGSFLTPAAIRAEADLFITSDIKYHEFFDADGRVLLADIGHYESEQFTIELLIDILVTKFPTFAILKSEFCTNPVLYYS